MSKAGSMLDDILKLLVAIWVATLVISPFLFAAMLGHFFGFWGGLLGFVFMVIVIETYKDL